MPPRAKPKLVDLPTEPAAAAKAAGLRYVSDDRPGIRRKPAGKSFAYILPDGQRIREESELRRIKALAIPPAYSDVWICPDPNGHLQATGRDDRRRKQYRYHAKWRAFRDDTKYERMKSFAKVLPLIRQHVDKDLAVQGLPRDKVLAAIVQLLQTSRIRVGNDEYAKENKSFGLTTLKDEHVAVVGSKIRFRFRGKSGKEHEIGIADRRLARIVKRCQDLPGQQLFQYIDDKGEQQSVDSADVNDYLRRVAGEDFTAKDFRTWTGTFLCALRLRDFEHFSSDTEAKKNITAVVKHVAGELGNTPTICRKCYVNPKVLEAYLHRTLHPLPKGSTKSGLDPEEAAVAAFLEQAASDDRE
ncbi:MAG: DNA topoisomerase IB [Candidatus Eremiobacteraeota bacterium]|nr:DNA topoisomerase IB [Candidatus Eremiobacteraeota bacterium]MBC5828473.1 DNA topoisomerase IB [Candidatus Eremiobacteraeota bacterium]